MWYKTLQVLYVYVISITNTRHQKWKDNMNKKLTFIYKYNSLYTDNKEAGMLLFYGSLG